MDLAPVALELAADPRWVDEATLPLGAATLAVDDALVFDVLDRDHPEVVVGWVVLGAGELSWGWQTRAEAFAALADLSVRAGVTPEDARRQWAERRTTERVDAVVALGEDPTWRAVTAAAPTVAVKGRAVSWTAEGATEQVVVLAFDPPSRAEARRHLDQRTREWRRAGVDGGDALAEDRVRGGAPHRLVALHAERPWTEDGWLTWLADPTGGVDDTLEELLAVHRREDWRVLTGVPRTTPLARALVERAEVRATASTEDHGQTLVLQVEATLMLEAEAPTPFVDLVVPYRAQPEQHYALRHFGAPDVRVLTEGAVTEGSVWGIRPEPRGVRERVVMPHPIDADGVELTVSWRLRRPSEAFVDARQMAADSLLACASVSPTDCAADAYPQRASLGASDVGLDLVPGVDGQPRFPAAVTLDVELPEGWSAVRAGAGSHQTLSVARGGAEHDDGAPAIEVLHHRPGFAPAPAIRDMVALYERVLPDFPGGSLAVVQGPDRPWLRDTQPFATRRGEPVEGATPTPAGARDAPTFEQPSTPAPVLAGPQRGQAPPRVSVEAGDGLIELRGVASLAGPGTGPRIDRDRIERDLAGAVAAQWWAALPWPAREAWLGRALPLVYRDLYVLQRWGPPRLETWREDDEDEDAARIVGGALADRVGRAELLEALDRYRRRGPWTADGLRAHLEAVVGDDLGGFFDPWMTGRRTRVPVVVERTTEGAVLRSPVAFGRMDVPVDVCGRRRCERRWVTLVDGTASLEAPKSARIVVDPDRQLPIDPG
ncbi:MAG: hypothetical protein H6735_31605 [Alphaproteobacteria bacterium]|nr:hypothetical protein [Alphaproteobacteria bacterium]